jgi:hypothetical protein
MANPDTSPEPSHEQAEPPTPTTLEPGRGIIGRWRKRHPQRRLARLLRPRGRRALAESLRRTAKDATDRKRKLSGLDQAARRTWAPDLLLHYRAAAVRTELLEIAALLEQATDPDPACVREIHELLTNGDSPLYHPGVHVSELYATLHYIRAGLRRDHASRPAPTPHLTDERAIEPGRPEAGPGERTKR